jgi:hypothetical protein
MATTKKAGLLKKMKEFVAGILPSGDERKPPKRTMTTKPVNSRTKTAAKKVTAAAKTGPLKTAAKKTGASMDRKLIALSQPHEVRDWCKSLGCSEDQLRGAVGAVGRSAAKVREYLNK